MCALFVPTEWSAKNNIITMKEWDRQPSTGPSCIPDGRTWPWFELSWLDYLGFIEVHHLCGWNSTLAVMCWNGIWKVRWQLSCLTSGFVMDWRHVTLSVLPVDVWIVYCANSGFYAPLQGFLFLCCNSNTNHPMADMPVIPLNAV